MRTPSVRGEGHTVQVLGEEESDSFHTPVLTSLVLLRNPYTGNRARNKTRTSQVCKVDVLSSERREELDETLKFTRVGKFSCAHECHHSTVCWTKIVLFIALYVSYCGRSAMCPWEWWGRGEVVVHYFTLAGSHPFTHECGGRPTKYPSQEHPSKEPEEPFSFETDNFQDFIHRLGLSY